MNELERYLNEAISDPNSLDNPIDKAYNDGVKDGQKIVLRLDLPVLFHEWLDNEFLNTDDACQKLQCADTGELYRHWVDNVLTIET